MPRLHIRIKPICLTVAATITGNGVNDCPNVQPSNKVKHNITASKN